MTSKPKDMPYITIGYITHDADDNARVQILAILHDNSTGLHANAFKDIVGIAVQQFRAATREEVRAWMRPTQDTEASLPYAKDSNDPAIKDWPDYEVNEDFILDRWTVDDVLAQANNDDVDLSYEQACSVLETVNANRDANVGINWDVISSAIHDEIAQTQRNRESQK